MFQVSYKGALGVVLEGFGSEKGGFKPNMKVV